MLFDRHARGTNAAREVRGGITTFLTMAHILVANPSILAAAALLPPIPGSDDCPGSPEREPRATRRRTTP
jgi:xanthine/uracil/vitamin C permease (AzgA family)